MRLRFCSLPADLPALIGLTTTPAAAQGARNVQYPLATNAAPECNQLLYVPPSGYRLGTALYDYADSGSLRLMHMGADLAMRHHRVWRLSRRYGQCSVGTLAPAGDLSLIGGGLKRLV